MDDHQLSDAAYEDVAHNELKNIGRDFGVTAGGFAVLSAVIIFVYWIAGH